MVKECKQEQNKEKCNCTYSCSRKGLCCECISYHLARKEIPACFFPPEEEKTYDRSFENFARLVKEGEI